MGPLEGCECVTSYAHTGGSGLLPLQPQVRARFFIWGSPTGRSSFQVLFSQLVQNLGVREMTTPERLPGGCYQRGGCFQDSSPAHTHPQQLEDSRQAGGRQGGPLPDLSQKPGCEGHAERHADVWLPQSCRLIDSGSCGAPSNVSQETRAQTAWHPGHCGSKCHRPQ